MLRSVHGAFPYELVFAILRGSNVRQAAWRETPGLFVNGGTGAEIQSRPQAVQGKRMPVRPQLSKTARTFVMLRSSRMRGLKLCNRISHFAPFAEM
jgi:hypothetical protein